MNYRTLDRYGPLFAGGRAVEQLFGPEADWVEAVRKALWRRLDGTGGHPFVYEKDTTDYVFTVDVPPDVFERALDAAGYQRNILSALKTRKMGMETQTAHSSWVMDPYDAPEYPERRVQHDVYLFDRGQGRTDVYAHLEDSVSNPSAHLNIGAESGIEQQHAYVGPLDSVVDHNS